MKKNPFIQGAMIATIGIAISKILGIIYVIPFYAVIGEKGGALYGYAYTIYGIFLNLSSVGIPLAISRLTSEYNTLEQYHLKEKTFKIGKQVITTLSVISFIALMFFAPTIANVFIGDVKGGNTPEDVAFVIRIIATAILVVPTLSVTKGYLQGHKYITVSTISQVIEQAARVVIIIAGSYVAVKVLGFPIKVGVGIATFGATIGGLMAYLYLQIKMRKHKKELHQAETVARETVKISNKVIALKIVRYAAPFIFSSLIFSFYDFVDLSTVIKTLVNGLHYSVNDAETIMSILSTWGSKLNMIVSAIATGLVTSLIPNITSSFVKNNMVDVRNKVNKSLQILLVITIPMVVGLSLLGRPVWTVFYGYNELSVSIFKFYICLAIFSSIITTLNAIMQSLNEQVRMIIYLAIGLLIKITFNIPLMYSFERLGFNAGYGVIASSIIAITTSIVLMLIRLHKSVGVNYEQTIKHFITIIYMCLIMTIFIMLFQFVVPLTNVGRLSSLGITILYAILGASIYLFIGLKSGILESIFGEAFISKVTKKLRF
jgi:O-antigen/teichoic acid export membrane protein